MGNFQPALTIWPSTPTPRPPTTGVQRRHM
jgi:hypothetical protein